MSVPATSADASEPTGPRTGPAMTLWRLELLRLLRTHRWMILFGVYLLFGVFGPLGARYVTELVEQFGGGVSIVVPDPRPVDGLIQFVSNASQLGLLAVVVVAAAALAFDAHPERAAFLRARVDRPGRLVLAPYVVTTVATVLAMVSGTAVTVVLTAVLLGGLPIVEVVVGTAFGALYLAVAVAVVAAAASLVRSQIGTAFAALGALIMLPILAMVDVIRPWVPSELLTAVIALVEGEAATAYLRSAAVAVVAIVALLGLVMHRLERREL